MDPFTNWYQPRRASHRDKTPRTRRRALRNGRGDVAAAPRCYGRHRSPRFVRRDPRTPRSSTSAQHPLINQHGQRPTPEAGRASRLTPPGLIHLEKFRPRDVDVEAPDFPQVSFPGNLP